MTSSIEPFAVMVKPVGSNCNMRCRYCYYLNAEGSSPAARMSDKTLERFISSYIQASEGPEVPFVWHGGEPTLAGMDFYQRALELQQKYLPEGWKAWNELQTNGLALTDEWCQFLKEANFDVSLSLDGTAALHDQNRRDISGEATYERVLASVKRLQAHGIQPDLLCTVTSAAAREGRAVYRALSELGTGWVQFIPIVVRDGDGVTPESATPELYGEFLKDAFAEWMYAGPGGARVQMFVELLRVLSDMDAGVCWMRSTCGNVIVVEADGSVFACDHFVDNAHRLGSIHEKELADMMADPRQRAFGRAKAEKLTQKCLRCKYLSYCGGACPKDRFARTEDGEEGLSYLCPGLETFFNYAIPRLNEYMRLMEITLSGSRTREMMISWERSIAKVHSRNDPCPCGSGKKFKSCCMRRIP